MPHRRRPARTGHARRLSKPQAKPDLYRLLNHPATVEYHHSILGMLEYIGDESDVVALETWLDTRFRGELSHAEIRSIKHLMQTLAYLSQRGIRPASDLLGTMCDRDYWNDRNFTLPTVNTYVGRSKPDAFMVDALLAYALSGGENWPARVDAYLKSIDDPEMRQHASWQLADDRIRAYVEARSPSSRWPPIPDDIRDRLPGMFNGDFANPGRPL